MTTTKVYGCGGRYSFLNFFPCSACISKNDDKACSDILKRGRTTKHKEWCSDVKGIMWGRTPVSYYKWNAIKSIFEEVISGED